MDDEGRTEVAGWAVAILVWRDAGLEAFLDQGQQWASRPYCLDGAACSGWFCCLHVLGRNTRSAWSADVEGIADVQRRRGFPLDWRAVRRLPGGDNQGGGRRRGPEFWWRVWHGCRGGNGTSRVDAPRLVAAGSSSGRVRDCDSGTRACVGASSPTGTR